MKQIPPSLLKGGLLLLCAGAGLPSTTPGYAPESPYLQEPADILLFLEESTDFWLAAWDADDAAFYSDVSADGSPRGSAKAFLAQTRNAYAMSKAFMVTGDGDYLGYADGALRYMYDFGWDERNGGWWGQASPNGSINTGIWYNNDRWSFWQHYMLLGTSALVEATADAYHMDWLAQGNAINDEELWDNRPGYEGYFANAALDWSWKSGKGFTPTVDAVTTNALTNYLMTRDPLRLQRLRDLGDNIVYMVEGDHGHVVSFPSDYDNDWQVNDGTTDTSIGHHIKTAWCLARVFLMDPDPVYRDAAEQLMDEAWTHEGPDGLGIWDKENGIMRGTVDIFDGKVSGVADWWTVEQAVTGGLMNWYVSRKPEYLQMADEAFRFFMSYYYDYDNGEVYTKVASNGVVTNANKGDMFKAGYHSVELFYLLYVYGNLYLHNRPVTLHYEIAEAAEDRELHLWPVAIEDERLHILGVRKDGEPYAAYDGQARMLSIPEGQSGTFEVVFASRYATNPPAHFDNAWWEDWFGWYFHDREAYPWVFMPETGWSYVLADGADRAGWFYDYARARYFYTAEEYWPARYTVEDGWE